MRRLDAGSGLGWVAGPLLAIACIAGIIAAASTASPGGWDPIVTSVSGNVLVVALGMLFLVILSALVLRGVRHMLEQMRADILQEVTGEPASPPAKSVWKPWRGGGEEQVAEAAGPH